MRALRNFEIRAQFDDGTQPKPHWTYVYAFQLYDTSDYPISAIPADDVARAFTYAIAGLFPRTDSKTGRTFTLEKCTLIRINEPTRDEILQIGGEV